MGSAALIIVFAIALIGVIAVIIYNSLRGVRVTKEALMAYVGAVLVLLIVGIVLVFANI